MELIGLHYSPWTEKAKWALDYYKLKYRYSEHLLIFGMPLLKFKTKKWFEEVTVPALIDGKNAICDSFQIAQYVDQRGELFPEEFKQKIFLVNDLCEQALDSGRALLTDTILKDKNAQMGFLPKFIPEGAKSTLRFLATIGSKYIQSEFGVQKKALDQHKQRMILCLQEIEKMILEKDPVFDKFNFAHIAASCSLQMIAPPDQKFLYLDSRVRAALQKNEISKEVTSLVLWRNQIYQQYRK